mgnify:CR=1 FL=1
MYLIYQLLKVIVKIGFRIYFRSTRVANRQHLRFKGPAIVVSNHPNTLMDVLNVAAQARAQFHFLANSGLFKSRFGNWFFNTFYCIPIERLLDSNGKPVNNAANFARADAHLAKGGTLYIAPEGTSWMKRHLHPLKTGTARMAFSAESKNDYQLDLQIVPVGVNYSAPTRFRGTVFINAGAPLYVRDFRELYEQDPINAVRHVTSLLEEHLRPLMIDTRDEAEDELVKTLENILQNSAPLPLEGQFQRTKQLIDQLHTWQANDAMAQINFQESVQDYATNLSQNQLHDAALARDTGLRWWWQVPTLLLGLPLFLYGYLNHLLAAYIPVAVLHRLRKRANLYIGYSSTVLFAVGVFSFPLCYWLQSKIVALLAGSALSWWYLLSLPIAGFFTLWYQNIARQAQADWRWQQLEAATKAALRKKRAAIWSQLQKTLTLNTKTAV